MLNNDTEARIRAEAERAGQKISTFAEDALVRELHAAKRQPIDEWIAVLHQAPPVKPYPEIPAEALRREGMYEDRV